MEATCKWYDVGCGLNWLGDEIAAILQNLFQFITQAFADLIDMIPPPSFLDTTATLHIPSNVSYWLEMMEFQYGLTIFVSAYIARFLLRRVL
jgi:hypothetical protein